MLDLSDWRVTDIDESEITFIACDGDASQSGTIQRKLRPATSVPMYPNPAAEQISVAGPVQYQLTLYDARGIAVRQRSKLSGTSQLEVATLTPGVYVLQVVDTQTRQKYQQRVVVE